jgi:hypothetical protein
MSIEKKLLVLQRIAHTLNQASITWALGSSSFCYLKGVVPTFNDFDIFIAHGQGKEAEKLLASLGNEEPANYKPGQYGTPLFCEFAIEGVEVDMMEDFSIIKDGKEYPFPLKKEAIIESYDLKGEPIPFESLQTWEERYTLMGRLAKAKIIHDFLAAHPEQK